MGAAETRQIKAAKYEEAIGQTRKQLKITPW